MRPNIIPPNAVKIWLPPKNNSSSPSRTYQTPRQTKTRPIIVVIFFTKYSNVIFLFLSIILLILIVAGLGFPPSPPAGGFGRARQTYIISIFLNVPGQGFEPQFSDSESDVLPLDDPGVIICIFTIKQNPGFFNLKTPPFFPPLIKGRAGVGFIHKS